jgi:hypothetical protein
VLLSFETKQFNFGEKFKVVVLVLKFMWGVQVAAQASVISALDYFQTPAALPLVKDS